MDKGPGNTFSSNAFLKNHNQSPHKYALVMNRGERIHKFSNIMSSLDMDLKFCLILWDKICVIGLKEIFSVVTTYCLEIVWVKGCWQRSHKCDSIKMMKLDTFQIRLVELQLPLESFLWLDNHLILHISVCLDLVLFSYVYCSQMSKL